MLRSNKKFPKQSMGFTVLRSKAVSHRLFCNKQYQPPIVNYMRTTRQWEIQNSMFRTPVHCSFPTF